MNSMTEQIYEVRIIVRTYSITPRTEDTIKLMFLNVINDLPGDFQETIKRISVIEVYKQTR